MSVLRIPKDTLETIRELADGGSAQEVVTKAVELYRRHTLLQKANEAFAALRQDPEGWAREQAERDQWDETLGDGLEDE